MTGFDIKIFRRWQCFKQGKEENSQEFTCGQNISNREAHCGSGWSKEHRGRSTESKSIRAWLTGAWMKWNLLERVLTWSELERKGQLESHFHRDQRMTLPSPINLQQWGLSHDPNCKPYLKRETMAHILSGR